MAQHDYTIDNQTSSSLRADLNNALAAIVSQNSGNAEPATTFANQFWYDTLLDLLKQRNDTNSGWITLGTVDQASGKFEPNQTFATQAEAEAGTDNTKAMTALRTAQAIASTSGGYDAQIFTATGTWTKPTNAPSNAMVRVQMWAGGGSGAKGSGCGGGGGGAYLEFTVLASTLGATEAVTIGAGGANRSTLGNGFVGGNSVFAGKTIYGGGGGRATGALNGGGGGGLLGAGGSDGTAGLGGGAVGADNDGTNLSPATEPKYMYGGGGGGAGSESSSGSVFGGGGGGGTGAGGVSVFGGSGGAGAAGAGVNAVAGTAPAGGGGNSAGGTSGAGARGEVRIYTTW